MNSTTDESESALPWLARDITVDFLTRLLVAVFTLGGSMFAVFSLRFVRVQRAAYVLSRAQVQRTRGVPDYLLARPKLTEALQLALENPDYDTILVYGQRGSGKTTAIEQTLSTRSGVLQWTLSADEGAAATEELHESWKKIFLPWEKNI